MYIQQASSNQAIGDPEIIPNDLALPLAFAAAAAFPIVVVWLMWHFQDTTPGNTLHKQYYYTPGVVVFQTIMVVTCWVFIHHVLILIMNGNCTICDYPRDSIDQSSKKYLPRHSGFILYVLELCLSLLRI